MFFKIIGNRLDSHGYARDEGHHHPPLPLHNKEATPGIVHVAPFVTTVAAGSLEQDVMKTDCTIEHVEDAGTAPKSCPPSYQ